MARSNKKQIKKQKIIFIANIQAHHEIFNQDIICKLAENNFDVVVVAKKEKKQFLTEEIKLNSSTGILTEEIKILLRSLLH